MASPGTRAPAVTARDGAPEAGTRQRAGLMHPLWIEMRSSPMAYFFPALFGVGVWAAFQTKEPGLSYWPNAIMAVNTSVLLVGPVFAGLAAWLATRERRRDLAQVRLLALRPGWAFPIAELAAVTVWALLAHLVTMLVVTGYMLWAGAIGPWQPAMVVSGVLSAVFYPTLGYLAGRLVPRRFVPPMVAIGAYLITVLRSTQSGEPWYLLTPVFDELVDPFGGPQAGLYWRHGVWLLGLTGLLATVTALRVDRRRSVALATTGAVAVAAAGALLVSALGGTYYADESPPFSYECAEQRITICVHPAFGEALPGLHNTFGPLSARLTGTPAEITRLEQRPRGLGEQPSPGAQAMHMDHLGAGVIDLAAQEYLEDHVDVAACFRSGAGRGHRLTEAVIIWLLDAERDRPGERIAEPLRYLRSLGAHEGNEWLVAHYRAFTTCELQPGDFRSVP